MFLWTELCKKSTPAGKQAMNDLILFSWQDSISLLDGVFSHKNSWGPNEKVRRLIEKLGFTIWVNQYLSTSKIT